MQNAILYQAYGGMDFINECRYSLLKYLQVYNLAPPVHTGIIIYTDRPEAFDEYRPFFHQFTCRPLTKETAQKWRGSINFVHRVKIEMIADAMRHCEGNLLYCDTDTYATAPLDPLFTEIKSGSYIMHQYEGVLDKRQSPSFHKWEKFLSATPIEYNGKKMEFRQTLKMFNAGVVGLSAADKDILTDVLAITDSVYQKFPKHIAEQFAFSYCLQKRGTIKEADGVIAHYWNLKEFRQLLAHFFSKNLEESIPTLVKKLHYIDALTIMEHKMAYKRQPALLRFLRKLAGTTWKIDEYEKKL